MPSCVAFALALRAGFSFAGAEALPPATAPPPSAGAPAPADGARPVFSVHAQGWAVARGSLVSRRDGRYVPGRWTVWSGVSALVRYAGAGPWAEATGGVFDLGPPAFAVAGFDAGWRLWARLRAESEQVDSAALLIGARWMAVLPPARDGPDVCVPAQGGKCVASYARHFRGAAADGETRFFYPCVSVVRTNHETMRRIAFFRKLTVGFSLRGKPYLLVENNASLFSLNWWYAPEVFGSAMVVGAGLGLRL